MLRPDCYLPPGGLERRNPKVRAAGERLCRDPRVFACSLCRAAASMPRAVLDLGMKMKMRVRPCPTELASSGAAHIELIVAYGSRKTKNSIEYGSW